MKTHVGTSEKIKSESPSMSPEWQELWPQVLDFQSEKVGISREFSTMQARLYGLRKGCIGWELVTGDIEKRSPEAMESLDAWLDKESAL